MHCLPMPAGIWRTSFLARPHPTLGKRRQLRRCGICRRPKPAWQLFYPLGDVRPLPHGDRPDRDLQCGRSVFAGGMRVGYYPHGYSVSRNLTSDVETGVGRRSVPQIVRALHDGQAPDRALNPFAMPWPLFHNFTSEDATAVATFLKMGSRPVHNLIPPKLSYGPIETVVMKLTRPLPSTAPKALTYGDGNFAIDAARGSPDRVQTILADAQWIILVLAVVLFARAGPWPGTKTSIGAVLAAASAGGLLYLLSQWPASAACPLIHS